MIDADLIQSILAAIALLAFVVLLVERLRMQWRHPQRDMGRLALVDLLLLAVGVELVFDALSEAATDPDVARGMMVVATAARGAIIAGGITLAATVEDWRERRSDALERRR